VSHEADREAIRLAVRKRYRKVAVKAEGLFNYPTGHHGARNLGYDPRDIAGAPPAVIDSFCGVGHPLSLERIEPDDSILDVGCGAGFDLLVAARLVGLGGYVRGIDSTESMVKIAARYRSQLGGPRTDVCAAACEAIPFESEVFDVVISNGMLNLSPQKDVCLQEVHRVLKPGGRFLLADIALRGDLPPEVKGSLDAWTQ
jgi:SAM-dependent methyltransferase